LLLSFLQFFETKNEEQKNDSSFIEDFILSSHSDDDFSEVFEFEKQDTSFSANTSQLQIGGEFSFDISYHFDELVTKENYKLIEENKKYLAIGLQWKEKYEKVLEEKKKVTEIHLNNLKKLNEIAKYVSPMFE
jgi:hypothetical protein